MAVTVRAFGERVIALATIMAFELFVVLVINERDVAVLAFGDVATISAHHKTRPTATVDEKHCLFAILDVLLYGGQKFVGKARCVAVHCLTHHIHNFKVWQGGIVGAFGEREQGVLTLLGFVIVFNLWSGTAEN